MSAALPAFQLASTLGPSPDEREEFAAKIRSKDAELEELREAKSGAMNPQEKQALILLLSDIRKGNEDLKKQAVKQAAQIEELSNALKDVQEDIEQIRDDFPGLIAEDRRNIKEIRSKLSILETAPRTVNGKTVKSHIDGLYDHMKSVGLKQVPFRSAAKILKISKQRLHQLKPDLALDQRFIIVHSQSHSQKELIRLREYLDG